MERIEIYTSKKKSFLLLIISIVFVLIGVWLLLESNKLSNLKAINPIYVHILGFITSVLFFGIGVYFSVKRLLKSELALTIDPIGLNINPKKSLTDFIKWEEILGFEEIKINSVKIVVIRVKNPESWLKKETNTIRKKLMQFNIYSYNSPFNISSSGLDINSNKLNEKLNSYFEKYKN